MKEAIVSAGPKVEIVDSPTPKPNDDQVVIEVAVSGSNPKDWKRPNYTGESLNTGDDIAGIVYAVGANVTEFKAGDRVAAFHEMMQPGGSFAEYAVAYEHATFHLPKHTSFEEGATIPLAAMTAAIGLYHRLGLPQPWTPAKDPIPLIIYGAASAVGAFAFKLAVQSNIHPILCVAGRGADFVKSLPGYDESKGDAIIDYRQDPADIVAGLKSALKASGSSKVSHAFDPTSEHGSYVNIAQVLDSQGQFTTVLPVKDEENLPKTLSKVLTMVGDSHTVAKDFANVYFRHFSRGLKNGTFSGHPYEVRQGGLGAIESALTDLKDGKASAVKYVFKIDQTEN